MTSPSVLSKSAHLIVDGRFVARQNFHSVVIVVALHVSKSSRERFEGQPTGSLLVSRRDNRVSAPPKN
jgi:hypothetical protein